MIINSSLEETPSVVLGQAAPSRSGYVFGVNGGDRTTNSLEQIAQPLPTHGKTGLRHWPGTSSPVPPGHPMGMLAPSSRYSAWSEAL